MVFLFVQYTDYLYLYGMKTVSNTAKLEAEIFFKDKEIEQLKAMIAEQLKQHQQEIQLLNEKILYLQRQLYGRRSEKRLAK